MRAVLPWSGPVMDRVQGEKMPDTMEHPGGAMGLTKYLQAREDAIRQAAQVRWADAGDSERPLLLCAASSPRGVGGGPGRAGGETVTCGRAAGGNSSSFLAGVTRPATARRMNSRRSRG